MSSWTTEQISFLRGAITLPSTQRYKQYCDRFGPTRTFDAVERQVRRLKAAMQAEAAIEQVLEEDADDEVQAPTPATVAEDKLRLALGRTPLVPIATAQDRLQFNEFIDDLIKASAEQKAQDGKVQPGAGSTLCILLSDTHIGKLTENFNQTVFEDRILSITDKISGEVGVVDDLKEIVLMLAGDMLEGEDIYQTQAHHIEMPAIDQVQIAVKTIWELMMELHDVYKVPVRVETCPGNHGRVSKTATEKTNWDNVIYQTLGFLAGQLNSPNITVNVNFDSFHTFPVQDKVGMIFHHGTKHLGTASMQQKVAGWLYTKEFDFMCHGHWHHWSVDTQFGKLVMKNGSLPGDDDLSERMGVFDPPRQGWLLVRKGQPINMVGFFEWSNE